MRKNLLLAFAVVLCLFAFISCDGTALKSVSEAMPMASTNCIDCVVDQNTYLSSDFLYVNGIEGLENKALRQVSYCDGKWYLLYQNGKLVRTSDLATAGTELTDSCSLLTQSGYYIAGQELYYRGSSVASVTGFVNAYEYQGRLLVVLDTGMKVYTNDLVCVDATTSTNAVYGYVFASSTDFYVTTDSLVSLDGVTVIEYGSYLKNNPVFASGAYVFCQTENGFAKINLSTKEVSSCLSEFKGLDIIEAVKVSDGFILATANTGFFKVVINGSSLSCVKI